MNDPALAAMAAAVAAQEPQMNALRLLRRLAENPPPDQLTGREKLAYATASFPHDEAPEIAEALGHIGVMAVEMFELRDGQLLVNEIAPRTHNSGHYTYGACVTSQFEQHVRAVCGLELGDPRAMTGAVMLNLIGDLWRDGALMGSTPAEAFFVKCDDETNPPESIDAGRVITQIGVAPVKPAEFVIFRLSQFAGGTQVEEGGENA